MKIAHFQVHETKKGSRVAMLTKRIEQIRGVMGVVAVRSMGLLSVLYDEGRVDPVAIGDAVVEAEAESPDGPASPPAPARVMPRGGAARSLSARVSGLA